jgi:hypothetical protein
VKGWEYLEYVYTKLGKENSRVLDPFYLTTLSAYDLVEQLTPLFADDGECTLDGVEERARFLIEIGKIITTSYGGKITNLIDTADGYLLHNGTGLYESLAQFSSFTDLLRKKSTLIATFMIDAGLLQLKDPENLIPIMDYHMQRVLLRTGCVEVEDETLKNALQSRKNLSSDTTVRNACVDATRKLSLFSGRSLWQVHNFLWPLGRSCCNTKMRCVDPVCNKNPCTFFKFFNIQQHDTYLFAGVCKGSMNQEDRNYWQPLVDTHNY